MACIAWLSSQEAPQGEVGEGEGINSRSAQKTGFEWVFVAAFFLVTYQSI